MPRKFLRRWMPNRERLVQYGFPQRFINWFDDPLLWHLNRRSVARSMAAGMIAGLIPGPLQMLGAALLALAWRCNLPLAVLVTLYSNPLTIGPLYWLAYRLGRLVLYFDHHDAQAPMPAWSEHPWREWVWQLMEWMLAQGWALAIGLPLLALLLGALGYLLATWGWHLHVRWEAWRRRRRQRTQ